MFSIYNNSERRFSHNNTTLQSSLPVPFNIQNVLHNLLFEDIGIEFTQKQKDMLETLRFSYTALLKMQKDYAAQDAQFRQQLFQNPDDKALKDAHEELQLDMFQAQAQFKEIVVAMSELLERNQYQKLLEFSNIPS